MNILLLEHFGAEAKHLKNSTITSVCKKTKVSFDDRFKIHITIIIFASNVYLVGSNREHLAKTWGHQNEYNMFSNFSGIAILYRSQGTYCYNQSISRLYREKKVHKKQIPNQQYFSSSSTMHSLACHSHLKISQLVQEALREYLTSANQQRFLVYEVESGSSSSCLYWVGILATLRGYHVLYPAFGSSGMSLASTDL